MKCIACDFDSQRGKGNPLAVEKGVGNGMETL